MALPPAICQIISEAQRLYNNAFSQMDETDDGSLALDLEKKFDDFTLSLDALLADLSQTLQTTSREISDLVNPNERAYQIVLGAITQGLIHPACLLQPSLSHFHLVQTRPSQQESD